MGKSEEGQGILFKPTLIPRVNLFDVPGKFNSSSKTM